MCNCAAPKPPVVDQRIRSSGLTFKAGETGFVFYDGQDFGGRHHGETPRTWAFGTIGEAAEWLVSQFPEVAS